MGEQNEGLIYLAIVIIWAIFSFISWITKSAKADKETIEKKAFDIPEQFRGRGSELEKEPSKSQDNFFFQEDVGAASQSEEENLAFEAGSEEVTEVAKEESSRFFKKATSSSGSSGKKILKNIKKKKPLVAAMIFHEIVAKREF